MGEQSEPAALRKPGISASVCGVFAGLRMEIVPENKDAVLWTDERRCLTNLGLESDSRIIVCVEGDLADREQHGEDAGQIEQQAGDRNATSAGRSRSGGAAFRALPRSRFRVHPVQSIIAMAAAVRVTGTEPSDPAPSKSRQKDRRQEDEQAVRVRVVRKGSDLVREAGRAT